MMKFLKSLFAALAVFAAAFAGFVAYTESKRKDRYVEIWPEDSDSTEG